MAKINTKALKARLTINDHKQIMQSLDVPIYMERPNEIVYYTGDKNVDAYAGSPKLIFYPDTGVYLGLTAGRSYDILGLVQTRLSLLKQPCSFMDAVAYILSVTGIESTQVQRVANPNITDWSGLERFITIRNGGSTLPVYDSTILDTLPCIPCQEWIDEGISAETQALYRIGWYGREWGTTIPVFDKDYNLVGIRCRYWSEDGVASGKYRPLQLLDGTIYKFPTNAVLYGLAQNQYEIERTGTVMIAESEKSVLKLHSFLGSQSTAVAMFGSQLGLQRRNQLLKLGVNHVILIVDNDVAVEDDGFGQWQDKIMKQANLWSGLAQVDIVWDNLGLLDIKENATDRDKETWEQLYESRDIDVLKN